MRKYTSKIISGSAKMALCVAKIAAGSASWWGFYQTEEPKILKSLIKKKSRQL